MRYKALSIISYKQAMPYFVPHLSRLDFRSNNCTKKIYG